MRSELGLEGLSDLTSQAEHTVEVGIAGPRGLRSLCSMAGLVQSLQTEPLELVGPWHLGRGTSKRYEG